MTVDTIRVVLVDDHAVVRAGLKAVLATAPDIQVVGEGSNGREAVALAERFKPEVVITDLSMPDLDGAGVIREIVAKNIPSRVLVLTMHTEDEYLVPLLEAGAAGYLVKSVADRELTKKDAAEPNRQRYEQLTPRERDVLRLIAQGYSAPEIGSQLGISPKTVDTYKQRIEEKLGLAHRSDYVQFAFKLGLLGKS